MSYAIIYDEPILIFYEDEDDLSFFDPTEFLNYPLLLGLNDARNEIKYLEAQGNSNMNFDIVNNDNQCVSLFEIPPLGKLCRAYKNGVKRFDGIITRVEMSAICNLSLQA